MKPNQPHHLTGFTRIQLQQWISQAAEGTPVFIPYSTPAAKTALVAQIHAARLRHPDADNIMTRDQGDVILVIRKDRYQPHLLPVPASAGTPTE